METAKAKHYHVQQTLALTRGRHLTLQNVHEEMTRVQFSKRGAENATLEVYFGMVGQTAVRNLDIKYKWQRAKKQLDERLALFTRHKNVTTRAASYSQLNCQMARQNLDTLLNNIASMEFQKLRGIQFGFDSSFSRCAVGSLGKVVGRSERCRKIAAHSCTCCGKRKRRPCA